MDVPDHENDHVITADENVVENFGNEEQIERSFCAGNVEDDDGGEVMVEVVGTDVLVDGVSSHEGDDELREDNLGRERESIDGKACFSSEFHFQESCDFGNGELNARNVSGLIIDGVMETSLREHTCDFVAEKAEPTVRNEELNEGSGLNCDLSYGATGEEGNLNCKDEDFDSSVVEVNLPCTAKVQSSSVDIVNMEIDDGVTMGNAAVLDQQVEVSVGAEEKLHSVFDAMETDHGQNLSYSVDGAAVEDKTSSNPTASHDLEVGFNVGPEGQVEEQRNKGKQGAKVKEQNSEFEQSMATDQMTLLPPESESEFSVSDLVWGKVRSHPWWPGQIFVPTDASEKAKKHHKKDCFLVAYFGDRTFAWNDASVLKPFANSFSQIDKQSNSEAFHAALNSALEEVSRRVQLGLTCPCLQKDSGYEMIESQIVDNAGIRAESSRRYGVDKSSGVNSFKPNELVEKIRALAKSPFDGVNQLELAISKAQLLAFSRFKGYSGLPEFQICGGLLENNADNSQLSDEREGISKSERRSSHKRKHKLSDSTNPRKKERPISELMSEPIDSMDSEDGDVLDSQVTSKSVLSSSSRKRKVIESVGEGSDKRISFYAAKVSTTTASTKPSFRVGECIRRVASQLTGSPSLVKGSCLKSPKDDESGDPLVEFEDSFETPENPKKGKIFVPQEDLSLDEMLVQLRSAARDPMKGYGVLKSITPFFSSFRHSIASGQDSLNQKPSTGKVGGGSGRKKKVPNPAIATPKEFEFDDVNESNDSYWTDRVVQNYDEEQPLDNAQNGVESQPPLALEPDKPRKPGRRPYKRKKQFSTGNHEVEAEEPTEELEVRKPPAVLPPTGLILNFGVGGFVPSEMSLNKMFKRFGALKESETEVDREANRARVVFKKGTDAEVAFNSAAKFNIFGSTAVNYELSYLQSLSFKSMPLETLQDLADAT